MLRQGVVGSQSRDLLKKDQIKRNYMPVAGRGGRTGSIEHIFDGYMRFLGWLILLDREE